MATSSFDKVITVDDDKAAEIMLKVLEGTTPRRPESRKTPPLRVLTDADFTKTLVIKR